MPFRRDKTARQIPTVAVPLGLLSGLLLLSCARPASAQQFPSTPNALADFDIPATAPNTGGNSPSSICFGPNGQLYIWDGTNIYEQTAGLNSNAPSTIGSITSGGGPSPYDSDPGPINFSANGQNIVVSEGAGGYDSTQLESNGVLFSIPTSGGATVTPIGSDPDTFDMIPLPGSCKSTGSAGKFLLDVGTNYGSEVDLFNASTGAVTPIVTFIPGASTSIAISGTNWSNYTLYVGVGDGSQAGAINSFSVNGLFESLKGGTAERWGDGATVEPGLGSYNTGAGMFVDPRGDVFTGGPTGIEVIVPGGGQYVYSIPYDTLGDLMASPSVTYNPITNQFAVQGYSQNPYSGYEFPLQQTVVYSASQFGVAATNLLNWTGLISGGGMNHSWDATGSTNWASNSSTVTYSDGDTVIFGDTNPYTGSPVCNNGGKASVTIAAGGVSPTAVMFTNTGAANGGVDYTICGGPIGGSATLELYGSGTVGGIVNLMSPNTFTGPVVVAAGMLNLQNTAALGNSSGVSVIAGATLQLQQSTGNQVTFGLTASNATSIPLNLYGTGITADAGELKSLGGNNIYGGAINVGSGGGQIVSSSTAGNDQLTLGGGVNVSTGATLTIAGPGKTTIDGAISGTASTAAGAPTTYGGDTIVAAGANLTVDQILQNTLTIGAGATVTIRPSGAGISATDSAASDTAAAVDVSENGDSVSAIQSALADASDATSADASPPIETLEDRVAVLSRLAATDPAFDKTLLTAENSLQSLEATLPSSVSSELSEDNGAISVNANGLLLPAADAGELPAPVPEPATSILLIIAGLILLGFQKLSHCFARLPQAKIA